MNQISVDRRYTQTTDPFVAEDLLQMQSASQYNNWLFQLIKPYLGKNILEVGPGIGNISRLILPFVNILVGVEPNTACQLYIKENLFEFTNLIMVDKHIHECISKDFEKYDIDTILCVNVLEHIEDDLSVIGKFYGLLPINGRVILIVPAIQPAYGSIDASVGHFRRYSITGMKNLLADVGFKVHYISYSNFLGLIGWWFNAKVLRISRQNDNQIILYNNLIPIISWLENKIHPPLGMSLIAVGNKYS